MKKQYKSSITKNHRTNKNIVFGGVLLQGYIASKLFLDFAPEKKKCVCETPMPPKHPSFEKHDPDI